MVSADNLNLDVLGLIFAFINTKYDQASIALVSRSFLAAVTPRLYAVLYYTFHEAKRYPTVSDAIKCYGKDCTQSISS